MQDQRNPTRRVMRHHRLAAHRECSLALKRRVIRCPSRTTGSCDEVLPRSVMLQVRQGHPCCRRHALDFNKVMSSSRSHQRVRKALTLDTAYLNRSLTAYSLEWLAGDREGAREKNFKYAFHSFARKDARCGVEQSWGGGPG